MIETVVYFSDSFRTKSLIPPAAASVLMARPAILSGILGPKESATPKVMSTLKGEPSSNN